MPRKRPSPQPDAPPAAPVVHVIHPFGIYFPDTVRALCRVRDTTVPREVRARRLRVARRGGRYIILGEWLLEWIRSGEVKPRARSSPPGGQHDAA